MDLTTLRLVEWKDAVVEDGGHEEPRKDTGMTTAEHSSR